MKIYRTLAEGLDTPELIWVLPNCGCSYRACSEPGTMPCWITLVDPMPGHLWVLGSHFTGWNIEPLGLVWLWAGKDEMNSKQRVSLAFTGAEDSSRPPNNHLPWGPQLEFPEPA